MTKNSARNWFFIGTFACLVIFFILSIHTLSRIPKYTHSDKLTGEVIAGKKVWEKHDCIGCHTLIGEGAYYAPELKDVYSRKGPSFIRAFLRDPAKTWYGSVEAAKGKRKMPNLHLSDEEINHLIAFFAWVDKIDTHNWPPRGKTAVAQAAEPGRALVAAPVESALVRRGEALVQAKACTACHRIKGVGAGVGPDLTGVTQRVPIETIRKRLKDPKSVKADSIMPNFGFTDEEVEAIIAYLKTL